MGLGVECSHPTYSLTLHRESINIWPKRRTRRNWLESAVVSSVAHRGEAQQQEPALPHYPLPPAVCFGIFQDFHLTAAPITLLCTLTEVPSFACCLHVCPIGSSS